MALPTLANKIDAVEDKIEKENIISEIAQAVFKSAKITTEAAAKFAVAPSVPQMVDDVLDDLKSGSIDKFNKAMDKLDKLVRVLGIDLKKYNKELANFAEKREQKIIKSEEKIQTLKEKNIIAEIEKSGEITILSNRDIEKRKDNLDILENNIKKLEKTLEKDRKVLQESDKLKTTAQSDKKEEIKQNAVKLEEMKKTRDKEKEVLGDRGEQQPGIFQRAREGTGNFVDEYIPDQIRDVAGAFTEGLTAPFTAIKELGMQFGQMLKPLKLLRPLFSGIVGSLKKFALGLKASVIAFAPYLAIAGLIVVGLAALYLILKKFKDRFGSEKTGPYDMGNQETDVSDEDLFGKQEPEKPKGYEGNMTRTSFVHGEHGTPEAKVVGVNDPDYDKLYREQFGKEPPKQGEVFNSRTGETSILPLTATGELIKSGNFMDSKNRSAKNLRSPDNLTRPSYEEKAQNMNNVIGGPTVIDNGTTIQATGLSGARDRDMEIFYIANPLYHR